MKTKIYISGAVSGTDDYIDRFAHAEKNLNASFPGIVFNPVRHIYQTFKNPEELEWDFIMSILLDELRHGDYTHIFMLCGWEKSSGAKIEHEWSKKLGMVIIYEKEVNDETL